MSVFIGYCLLGLVVGIVGQFHCSNQNSDGIKLPGSIFLGSMLIASAILIK